MPGGWSSGQRSTAEAGDTAHFAFSGTSNAWPPYSSTVTGSVCSLSEPGFGHPRRTYRPGEITSNVTWFLTSDVRHPTRPGPGIQTRPEAKAFRARIGGRTEEQLALARWRE